RAVATHYGVASRALSRKGERANPATPQILQHGTKENIMVIVVTITAATIALYYWLLLPRLRRLPWWDAVAPELRAVLERACARLRAFCGNSKTIAVAYAAELLGVLDEAKVLDWSQLLGADSAGRVMVIMGVVMILLRLVTRTAVDFKPQA